MELVGVNFHYVSDERHPYPGIHAISPADFERQLDVLAREYTFVSLQELRDASSRGRSLPARSCLLTFDDGLREQFDVVWPLLNRKGIAAAFFVNTRPAVDGVVSEVHKVHMLRSQVPPEDVDREITEECTAEGWDIGRAAWPDESVLEAQYPYDPPPARRLKYLLNFVLAPAVRDRVIARCFERRFGPDSSVVPRLYMSTDMWAVLGAAGCLGTHSHTHVPLATLDEDELKADIESSLQALRLHARCDVDAISYPYGGPTAVSLAVERAAARSGLRFGFTMERAVNRTLDRPLLLARLDMNDAPGGRSGEGSVPISPSRRMWFEECAAVDAAGT